MSTIAIIPARGGSTRIPGKNVKVFHGRPIIWYSIEAARKSGLFDRIIVSTDDAGIAILAEHMGAESYARDPEYGKDEVGTQEVVKECLLGIHAEDHDNVCCIYATAPLMSISDLCEGFMVLTGGSHGAVDYVMSVGTDPLQDAGQFYWGMACVFISGLPLLSLRTRLIPVDKRRVCDINTMKDWYLAEQMYEALK